MEPQPDDVFSDTDTWAPATPCGTSLDTPDWSWGQYRMTASDLNALISWQKAKRAQPTTAQLGAEMPFNAAYAANDSLRSAIQKNHGQFKWLNHTWDHTSWDDTDGNPLTNPPTAMGYSDAKAQVAKNNSFAKTIGFSRYKQTSLVTPEISGLHNPAALQGAYDAGIRHTVGDNSRAGRDLPVTAPNEGWYNNAPASYAPPAGSKPYSILVLPRHATNLFYNVSTPAQWTAEYNCMYKSYWGKDLSYQEVLDKESDMLLSYLLKGSIDPVMFHQANLRAYDGSRSLMGDLLDRTLAKYNALYKLPVLSPTEDEVAHKVAERMAYSGAGVSASVVPGQSITITAQKAATVPVTGLQTTGAQLYGGQHTSYVKLAAGQSVTLPLQ